MPLQSQLFRGDPKLEAAAVSDPAHIIPGARGEHVRKIQVALARLEGADLDPDGAYGPATAAVVLAYKQRRDLVNRAYQAQADDIVGKMTMASLDREMLEFERSPPGPIRLRGTYPGPGHLTRGDLVRRSAFRGVQSLDSGPGPAPPAVDPPAGTPLVASLLDPSRHGTAWPMRLTPRSTGTIEVVHGKGGNVTCHNLTAASDCKEKTGWIYDVADTSTQTRLNPEPVGPQPRGPAFGGDVGVNGDPSVLRIDAFRPGFALVSAFDADGSSSMTMNVAVLAPRLGPVPRPPLTKTRLGSRFLSSGDGSEPDPHGIFHGRPVDPTGTGRKICLGGETETPQFEDYSVNLPFSGFRRDFIDKRWVFRPWTEDPDPAVGVRSGEASGICIRGVPYKDETAAVIKRIAAPRCRFTFSGGVTFLAKIKGDLGAVGFRVVEEFAAAGEIVLERG